VDPRADLDFVEKRDLSPLLGIKRQPFSPQTITVLTELSQPPKQVVQQISAVLKGLRAVIATCHLFGSVNRLEANDTGQTVCLMSADVNRTAELRTTLNFAIMWAVLLPCVQETSCQVIAVLSKVFHGSCQAYFKAGSMLFVSLFTNRPII
jgi:hypothetical protein